MHWGRAQKSNSDWLTALSSLAVLGAETHQLVHSCKGTLSKYLDGCSDNCKTLSTYFNIMSPCTHCWACRGSCFIDRGCEDYILVTVKMVTSPAYGQGCLLPHPFTVLDQSDVTTHITRCRVSCSPKGTCPTPCDCRLVFTGICIPACHTGAAGAWKSSSPGSAWDTAAGMMPKEGMFTQAFAGKEEPSST